MKIPSGDDWMLKNPEQTDNNLLQMAGVFTVNGRRYFCSLILLSERPVLEFMAFRWNEHANKVTNWMDVFSEYRDFNPNYPGADVDVQTFNLCIKNFFDFLVKKEEKENDDRS